MYIQTEHAAIVIEFSQPSNVKKGQQETFVKYWNQPKIVIWQIKLDQQPICQNFPSLLNYIQPIMIWKQF